MKISVLASGSKGNATYVETKHSKFLIDCGISYRQIKEKLKDLNISLDTLDAVFITHEHSDHIKGLFTTLKQTKATLYASIKTYHYLKDKLLEHGLNPLYEKVEPNQSIVLKDLSITPLSVSHDALDTLGYVFNNGEKKLVHMTDIGFLPQEDYSLIKNANTYVFESNYDVSLLFSSNRPYYLKRRIDSVKGHLSNADSAYHLSRIIGQNTKRIILAHASEDCNTDEHIIATFQSVFASYDIDLTQYEVHIAKQYYATKLFDI